MNNSIDDQTIYSNYAFQIPFIHLYDAELYNQVRRFTELLQKQFNINAFVSSVEDAIFDMHMYTNTVDVYLTFHYPEMFTGSVQDLDNEVIRLSQFNNIRIINTHNIPQFRTLDTLIEQDHDGIFFMTDGSVYDSRFYQIYPDIQSYEDVQFPISHFTDHTLASPSPPLLIPNHGLFKTPNQLPDPNQSPSYIFD